MLEELLVEGAWGTIKVGANFATVMQTAGHFEERVSGSKRVRTLSTCSRRLQVCFADGRVVWFGLYFRYDREQSLDVAGFAWPACVPPFELCRWLFERGVVLSLGRSAPECGYYQFGHGVAVVYDDEGRVDSIQVSGAG